MHQRAKSLRVNFFQIGCSEQLNKTHNFRKIIFVTSSLWNSIDVGFGSVTKSDLLRNILRVKVIPQLTESIESQT